MLTKEIPSGWSSTNDLRNINKDKLISNPNMKPMKNPIHRHFTDEIKDVFERFGFALKDYYGKGGHNNIYRNKQFVFRITKLYLNLEDESKFDEDKHLDIQEKYCLVGEYHNKRGCIEVADGDKCMSGQVFPSQQLCLNPTLTQNSA